MYSQRYVRVVGGEGKEGMLQLVHQEEKEATEKAKAKQVKKELKDKDHKKKGGKKVVKKESSDEASEQDSWTE